MLDNQIKELTEDRNYWRDLFLKHEREQENARGKKQLKEIKVGIQKLTLSRGDIVVISAPGMITDKTAKRLKEYFEKIHKKLGVKAMIFGDGLRVTDVIRKKTGGKK